MSDHTAEPALAFLRHAQPLCPRDARWNAATPGLMLRLAELSIFFLVSLVVAACIDKMSPAWALLVATAATIAAVEAGRPARRRRPATTALLLQLMASILAGGAVLLLAGAPWPQELLWGAGDAAAAAVLLGLLYLVYTQTMSGMLATGRFATQIAVVGTGPAAAKLVAQLEQADKHAIRVVGRYAATEQGDVGDEARGTLRTLICDCRLDFVDAIVLAPEPAEAATLAATRDALAACTQEIFLAPGVANETGLGIATLGQTRLLRISRPPMAGGAAFAKRAFDIVGAAGLLLFMLPLLLVLALAIAIDSRGPILFRQLRVGYNNQLFYIFKFRSMRNNAADRLAKQQTVRGDKRVTRVGRVIRRLSLDELPQLLNVLRGEMSLVGPRPHAPGTSIGGQRIHTVVDHYARRHIVRPGITGLAQVRGLRGGLQNRRQVVDRLASDLEYIERWSLWFDIRILFGTVLLEMRKRRGC